MIGIYSITNIINGKLYIGKSKNIKSRWLDHERNLRKNKHHNDYLQNAWNKYGEVNFKFDVVEITDEECKLDELEIYYIKQFNSTNDNYGYNIREGGDGGSMGEYSKAKLRKSMRESGRSFFTEEQARHIKMMLWCLMDRNEIAKTYNVTSNTIKSIACGNGYEYILKEYNDDINNMKRRLIDERNEHILKLYDSGHRIIDIHNETKLSISIIEKCVYRYRDTVKDKKEKYQKLYDEVMKLYSEGYNPYNISKILDIGNSTVNRYIKNQSNPYDELNFKKIKEKDKLTIIDLYFNKNISIKEIANLYNVSKNTIENCISHYKHANTEVS